MGRHDDTSEVTDTDSEQEDGPEMVCWMMTHAAEQNQPSLLMF